MNKQAPAPQQQQALDQSAMKTLALWTIWASISAAVFIQLYHQADIWTHIRQDTSHVTQVIMGVFLLGVLISFIHTLILTREWFCAYRLEKRMEATGLHSIRPVKGRTVSRLITALQHISNSGGQIKITELSTLEFATHIRTSRLVALLGSLLITMGLIGTVLGLTITLTGLNSALKSVGSDGLSVLLALREAMAGMGLAFYTTLLGSIMGGILLRVFAYLSDNSIEALQDMMVRSCMVYASTEFRVSPQKDLHALDQVVEGMEIRLNTLTESLQTSRIAMAEFSESMKAMQKSARLDEVDDEVFKAIAVHRHYAKILRYELRLQKQLGSFRERLLAAMGFQSSNSKK